MPAFEINVAAGPQPRVNGKLQRRVVLNVAGRQVLIDSVTLDNTRAKEKAAKTWSERFQIDAGEALKQLDRLALAEMAEAEEKRRDWEAKREAMDAFPRVSTLADAYLKRDLQPVWHRGGKSIYCAAPRREIPVGNLWTYASNAVIDAVGKTKEGAESGPIGSGPTFKTCLGIFRDAVTMAAARLLKNLPPVTEVEVDETADHDQLKSELVAWLLKERSYRLDCGTPVTISFFAWAWGVEIGGWQQCFSSPVFARRQDTQSPPEIAVKGEMLTRELRKESKIRLAKDLRKGGLVVTDETLRCGGKVWRVWVFTPAVVNSVAQNETESRQ